MALWFECKVRYDKMMENGSVKRVTEPYLVDALSFTEAEARITEEVRPFISGDFSIPAIKKTNIAEIFYDQTADKWWSVNTTSSLLTSAPPKNVVPPFTSWFRPAPSKGPQTASTKA